MTIQALLSERLKAAVATSRLYPGDTALILEAIPVLEAAEALVAYRDRVGPLNFQLEKADHWIGQMRALAAHGPSQG